MARNYFFSYNYTAKDSFGFGTAEVSLSGPVDDIQTIRNVEAFIKQDLKLPEDFTVTVLNWRRFEDPI